MVESQAMPLGREDYKYPKGSFYLVVEGSSFFLQQLLYKHSFGANKGGFLFPYVREIPGDPAKTPERQKKKKCLELHFSTEGLRALSSCPNYSFVFILVVAIIVLWLKIPLGVNFKPLVARTGLK